MIDLILWIALGIAAGSIAKFVLPGPDPGGTLMTIVLGIAGAFVGGFAGVFLPFLKSGASASISVSSLFTATVGAILILAVARALKKS